MFFENTAMTIANEYVSRGIAHSFKSGVTSRKQRLGKTKVGVLMALSGIINFSMARATLALMDGA